MTIDAFFQNFNNHASQFQAYAMSLTKDSENASDLYQEAVYRALKNREKFREGTNFKAWMVTLIRNIFINDYRKKKFRKTRSEPTGSFVLDINSGIDDNSGYSNVRFDEIYSLVEKLDYKEKYPFMRYYNGFSYKEIAEDMELPLGTVKSRIFHARKKLKKMIDHLEKVA